MKIDYFLDKMEDLGIDFYSGVPDSQLKALGDTLYSRYGVGEKHVIAANEGGAAALAAGHYLATGHPALVYLQNSGIGNIVNPVTSLLNQKVYAIPCVFVVGWRGEPGIKDEPQHAFQGEITVSMMELLGIKSFVLSSETSEGALDSFLSENKQYFSEGNSISIIVQKDALTGGEKPSYKNDFSFTREEALTMIFQESEAKDFFVSTTGKTSREVFEIRESLHQKHDSDFLTVGSMGHASMIAMGIAMSNPSARVWCLDGDGAAVMHMGHTPIIANHEGPFIHVLFNNYAYESVGGQPVGKSNINFCEIFSSCGYQKCIRVTNEKELKSAIEEAKKYNGVMALEIMVSIYSRDDLGRPTTTPIENKNAFMKKMKERKGI